MSNLLLFHVMEIDATISGVDGKTMGLDLKQLIFMILVFHFVVSA